MDFKVDCKLEGEPSRCWWHHPVGHFGGRTKGVGGSPRLSQPQIQPTHQRRQRRQDQGNGEQRHSVPHTHSEWTTGAGGYVPVPDYRRRWVYDGIPYQVKQRAGDRGITAENMEKSQHTDFNEDTTDESASVACSNVWLWQLDSQKAGRNILSLDAFEMKRLGKILQVLWTAKKTNEWVLNEAE